MSKQVITWRHVTFHGLRTDRCDQHAPLRDYQVSEGKHPGACEVCESMAPGDYIDGFEDKHITVSILKDEGITITMALGYDGAGPEVEGLDRAAALAWLDAMAAEVTAARKWLEEHDG